MQDVSEEKSQQSLLPELPEAKVLVLPSELQAQEQQLLVASL